jgi:hypothetical protein
MGVHDGMQAVKKMVMENVMDKEQQAKLRKVLKGEMSELDT